MTRKSGLGAKSLAEFFASNPDISMTTIADALGVSVSAVSKWASGERTPRLKVAVRLSKLTGVPAYRLIAGEHEAVA